MEIIIGLIAFFLVIQWNSYYIETKRKDLQGFTEWMKAKYWNKREP